MKEYGSPLRAVLVGLLLPCGALLAAGGAGPSPPEPAAARTARAAPADLPTPESVLGFRVGDDFKLARYDESIAYFRALAAASDRVRLLQVGHTSWGQPWTMAVISSPENLARIDEYREIARRLAHPRGEEGAGTMLTDAQARQLARTGRAIVHIDGGLHASEVAHAQHTIQLAYDLASSDDPAVLHILDQVILMLWPSVNPDGQDIVVDWYRGNVGGPYEVAPLPWLYQKYVGHDNNRDAYMLEMIESRVLARTWRAWEPQIIYIHHQSSPFPTRIWLPPFAEPVANRVHPLMTRTVNAIGMLIARALEERGQVGAVHMGTGFDAWYPGYVDFMPMLRNVAAWWTETALYRYATPKFYTLEDFPRTRRDLRPESLYSSPWRGGWWRLRDAVEYMLTASKATLQYAADYRESLLYNRYQAARDTIERYRQRPPYLYLVPQGQRDPVAAAGLLRRLAFNGVRVHQLGEAIEYEGNRYDAGTWVVFMDQEDAALAEQVLEVQRYPDLREYPEGPPEQPYDAAGWTLPYQMGVRVVAGATPPTEALRAAARPLRDVQLAARALHAALAMKEGEQPAPSGHPSAEAMGIADEGAVPWTASSAEEDPALDVSPFDSVPGVGFDTDPVAAAILPPAGRVTGDGPVLELDPAQNNAYRALNRAWAAGARVEFAAAGGQGGQARYLVRGLPAAEAEALVRDLALQARRGGRRGRPLQRPRVGLYRPWTANMDEGWTRWLLERYEFAFRALRDAEVRAGSLRDRYEVIVLPSARPQELLAGNEAGSVPPRFAGGLGEQGVRALRAFVRAGGTLVCLNGAVRLALERFDLPLHDAVAEAKREEFFAGISLLRGVSDTSHPLAAGMPGRASLTSVFSPVLEADEGFAGELYLRYPERGDPLLSGYLLGGDKLAGAGAAARVPYGDGQLVLLAFAPQWRGQPFGTFRLLFNALLLPPSVAVPADTGATTDR